MRASNRTTAVLGMVFVADAVTFLVDTDGQIRLWTGPSAPAWYRRAMAFFDKHRGICRVLAAAELLTGVSLIRSAGRLEERGRPPSEASESMAVATETVPETRDPAYNPP